MKRLSGLATIGLSCLLWISYQAACRAEDSAKTKTAVRQLAAGSVFAAQDTLSVGDEELADAKACLAELAWVPTKFDVHLAAPLADHQGEWLVRFPSPRPVGDPVNDLAAMEWYQVRDDQGDPLHAPAAVIIHESGSNMTVGRLIAKSLRSRGVHTFMLQLPYYGVRRGSGKKPSGAQLMEAMCQSIVDARRAKDAVAALPFVDKERVSLQGTSLGGFVTATTAGLDQAYFQVFILLAGGDLHSVLINGKKDAVKVRAAMTAGGVTDEDFQNMLYRIEPLRLAHRVEAQRVWLFSGRYDEVVPPANSELFAQAAGLDEKHHQKMLANHYSGILFLPMLSEQMSEIMLGKQLSAEESMRAVPTAGQRE